MDHDPFLVNLLAAGLAQCGGVAADHRVLLPSLFLAGLIGSGTHCVGMCGPFVLAQTVARLDAVPAHDMREWHRLTGAALVPYHLGRMTTYAALGAAAAALLGGVADLAALRWLSATMLATAALFFVGYALRGLAPRLWPGRSTDGPLGRALARSVRPLFVRPVGWRGYALGMVLGLLPCGLLWGALAAAASSGSALAGGFAMIAFTLGTIPALLAVGIAGHVAGDRFRGAIVRAAPTLMLVNAATLSYLAWRTIA